jgi:hypothetical protein
MPHVFTTILEDDYPEFKRMMAMPLTYAAWLKGRPVGNGMSGNDGVREVHTVSPGKFREYLSEHGKAASEEQLRYCASESMTTSGAMWRSPPTSDAQDHQIFLLRQ